MKPRDVSVGIYDAGGGKLKVWSVTFTIPGSLSRTNGKIDETDRRRKEKEIAKLVESLDFPGEEVKE
jgi:hypothetical protein